MRHLDPILYLFIFPEKKIYELSAIAFNVMSRKVSFRYEILIVVNHIDCLTPRATHKRRWWMEGMRKCERLAKADLFAVSRQIIVTPENYRGVTVM